MQLVEADLLNSQSLIKACEGADYIVHTASPFQTDVKRKDESKLIKPAVNGTLAVMMAAAIAKVKKVVITSSVASIGYGHSYKRTTFSEADWSIPENCDPYAKSKVLAEKAAW